MLARTFEDDEQDSGQDAEADPAADPALTTTEEPEYTFEGFEVEVSERIALTPVAAPNEGRVGR